MKRVFLLVCLACLPWGNIYGQGTSAPQNARRVVSGTGVPTAPCQPGPIWTSIYIRTTTGVIYRCSAAPSTWAAVGGGGDASGPASSTDNAVARFDGTGGKTLQNSAVIIADTTGNISGPQKITLGTAAAATGSLEFNGTTSGTVTVKPADAAGTWTLTLPANDGDADQVLQTNGSGVTSWAAAGGGLPSGLTFSSPDFTVGTAVANQAVLSGSATTAPVKLEATGSDTNIDITLTPKGNGSVIAASANASAGATAPLLFGAGGQAWSSASSVGGVGLLADGNFYLTAAGNTPIGFALNLTTPTMDLNGAGVSKAAVQVVEVNNGTAGTAGVVLLRGQTIASLPASPVLGMRATVTDGDSGLAWGATAVNTGAGATKYAVWYNGTAWTVVGK